MSKQQQVEIVRGTVVIGTGAKRQLGDTRSFSNQTWRALASRDVTGGWAARLARSGEVKVAQLG